MGQWKLRLLSLIFGVLAGWITYDNWQQLNRESQYNFKVATFGPVILVGCFFLLLFPSIAGRPETTKQKIIVLSIFAIGLAAGALNLYLMDPGFFRP